MSGLLEINGSRSYASKEFIQMAHSATSRTAKKVDSIRPKGGATLEC